MRLNERDLQRKDIVYLPEAAPLSKQLNSEILAYNADTLIGEYADSILSDPAYKEAVAGILIPLSPSDIEELYAGTVTYIRKKERVIVKYKNFGDAESLQVDRYSLKGDKHVQVRLGVWNTYADRRYREDGFIYILEEGEESRQLDLQTEMAIEKITSQIESY